MPTCRTTLFLLTPFLLAQTPPGAPPPPSTRPDEVIKIIQPTIDKQNSTVTLPAAFWNQNVADWLEVALCGRPSDFLHETLLSVTTTRELLEQSLRDIGCHDADAWAVNVHQFPRIRGDHLLALAEFTYDGKKETYSLDELLAFQGWNVSMGPYGFLFRGDPGGSTRNAATHPAPAIDPALPPPADTDAMKILRDDPQFALAFKGLQSMSQSFADHPIAYDDWIYPPMNIGRNYAVLSAKVFNSNGDIPVTLTIKRLTEEEFLTQSAKVWHDPAYSAYILKQLPIAQAIDRDKSAFWAIMDNARESLQRTRGSLDPAALMNQVQERTSVPLANIEKNYTALDAAWAAWAADHAKFTTDDPQQLAQMKLEAKRWSEHLTLEARSAAQRALAETAASQQKQLAGQPQTDAVKSQLQKFRGAELIARSAALIADNRQSSDYWNAELARIDPKDPRTDWIKNITMQRELIDARLDAARLGISYGNALQTGDPNAPALQSQYAQALLRIQVADLNLQIVLLDFEITKRQGFDNDPDLPGLKEKKGALESRLKLLQSAAEPPVPGKGI